MQKGGASAVLTGAALVLFFCLGACAHRPWEEPGDRFQKVKSPHFVVLTDAAADEYGPVIERLEIVYRALTQTFFPKVDLARAHVLLLARERDFKGLVPKDILGFYAPAPASGTRSNTGCSHSFRSIGEADRCEPTRRS